MTDDEFKKIVAESVTIAQALKRLGLKPAGGNYKTFACKISRLAIDTSHMLGRGHAKGIRPRNAPQAFPLSFILVLNGPYVNSSQLKKKLINAGFLKDICSQCNIFEWQGKKISLHLDHKDGNYRNNVIDNLRLLCPNCHSQTPTYCRKKTGVPGRI